MAAEPIQRLTALEYLDLERRSPERHEYLDGTMYAMSGASEPHNTVVANIGTELNLQMRGRPCRVYIADMRVATSPEGPFYYPDVVALCGQPELLDKELDTLVNPMVVVEVLSPSTEGYDRGEKFARYRRIPTLVEYLLVSQTAMHIERFSRDPEGRWVLSDYTAREDELELPAIGCTLALSAIYDKVELDSVEP